MRDTEGALADFATAVEQDPSSLRNATRLASSYLLAEQFENASEQAKLIQGRFSDISVGHILEALALVGMGRTQDGVTVLETALVLDPGNPTAGIALARLQWSQGDQEGAKATFREILSVHPEHESALIAHAELEARVGRLSEAEKLLNRAIAATPQSVQARTLLSRLFLVTGRPERAIETAEAGLELNPDGARALEAAALALTGLKLHGEGAAEFEKLAELRPDQAQLSVRAAKSFTHAGRWQDAIDAYDTALRVDPGLQEEARLPLTKLLLLTDQVHRAKLELKGLARNLPDNPEVTELKTWYLLTAEGAMQKGIEVYQRALRLDPADTHRAIRFALALWVTGRQDEAVEIIRTWFDGRQPESGVAIELVGFQAMARELDVAREIGGHPDTIVSENGIKANGLGHLLLKSVQSGTGHGLAAVSHLEEYFLGVSSDGVAIARGAGPVQVVAASTTAEGADGKSPVVEPDPSFESKRGTYAAEIEAVLDLINSEKFEEALKAAQWLQAEAPDNPQGYTLAGLAFVGRKESDEARAAFLKALTLQPGAPDASSNLASLALAEGDVQTAREHLEDSLAHFPDHAGILTRLATIEERMGNAGRTIELLERAVKSRPTDVRLTTRLGRVLLKNGQEQRALSATRRLVGQYPNDSGLLEVVGRAQLAAGQAPDAILTFRALTHVTNPPSEEAFRLLAVAFEAAQNLSEAKAAIDQALSINPKHVRSLIFLSRMHIRDQELEQAREVIDLLKQDLTSDPRVIEIEATIAMVEQRPADAAVLLKQVFEAQPTSARALRLAIVQWQASQHDNSIKTLEAWRERMPADTRAHLQLASYYLLSDQLEAAKASFMDLLQQIPDSWIAHNNLAHTLLKLNEIDEAEQSAARGLEVSPQNAMLLSTLALIYLERGRADEAIEILRDATQRAPHDPTIRYRYARALFVKGQLVQARSELENALSSTSEFPERGPAEDLLDELEH